jgi:hypothetical protein
VVWGHVLAGGEDGLKRHGLRGFGLFQLCFAPFGSFGTNGNTTLTIGSFGTNGMIPIRSLCQKCQ